jgi:signal transduction histidine kinase
MRIRRKVLIIMAFAGIIQTLALYTSTQLIIVSSFARLEEQYAKENVERTLSALSNEFADLSSKTGDYAEWDETYVFVQDANEEYIQNNLDAPTWANLRVDVVLFINTAGQIVFGTVFQPDMTTTPIPHSLVELISANDTLWNHPSLESRITGIVPLSEEPLLIASRPILTSFHEGPIRGALIMGRYLDSEEIEYLSQTVHLPLSLSRFSDSETNSDFYAARQSLSKEKPAFEQPLNADTVAGYALLTDIYGDPFLVLKATIPRDIYKQGQTSATYFLAALITTGIIFGLVVTVIQEKQLVSQLDRLATEVRKMGKRKSLSEHLAWESSTDEVVLLAGAIDSMMEERLNTIEQVAAMVGHDLRNPLTGISNAAYYLRMKMGSNLGPKATEMLDLIDKDVEYSNKIINDLLEYSRAIKLEPSENTPKSLIKDVLALVTVPANVQVVDFTEDKPKIKVDADKIKRSFVNIIKNAFDAMPEGGKLIVESRKKRDKVEISFTDTGAGIPKETLEGLFTPLFTTKAKGMGFGLAICKRIIEAHGGKISVESTVGKGTTFTLIIPIEPMLKGGDKL